MIQLFVSLIGGTFLLLFGFSFFEKGDYFPIEVATEQPIAVVELFTSQGCSSCPPADRVLTDLVTEADKKGQAVYALSFHVDYWNYLGWKDPFSDAKYSERQRKYARKLFSQVYTPQMVVNGQAQFIGSRSNEAKSNVKEALAQNAIAKLALQSKPLADQKSLQITYEVSNHKAGQWLQLALVQKAAQTAVARGENRGRDLSHNNIVRHFETIDLTVNGTGNHHFNIPNDLNPDDLHLIAYVQDQNSWAIIGATTLELYK